MKKRWQWMVGVVLLGAAIIAFGLIWNPSLNAEALSKEAAEQAILTQYPGVVMRTSLKDGVYWVQLKTETGLYEAGVDPRSGDVVSLKRLEAAIETKEPAAVKDHAIPVEKELPPPDKEPQKGEVSKPEAPTGPAPQREMPKILTSKEAAALSAAHVKGEAQDVELRGAGNGTAYYLVEVDVDDESDATVQVNAISGVIMSVTWDDDDDDDDDD